MRKFINNFTKRQLKLGVIAVISLFIFLFIILVSATIKNLLETQHTAARWDTKGQSTQVSCFISENTQITPKQLVNLEHYIDAALQEISITSENENARLWSDAYSARGEITVASSKTTITGKAIGVGGDFFLFHPFELQSGSYFGNDNLMQDYIILDEDAAWQLFGSNDIVGMQVTIKGVPHIVKGVIKRETGRMNDKAGNDKITFYLSYESLMNYGTSKGINAYEIVMPNPISGFALKTVKEKIGIEETNMELVENTKRYSLFALIKVIGEFGTRSMNQKAIVYPYWENVARGYEDVLAMILFLEGFFLSILVGITGVYLVYRFKHRTWSRKTILEKITLVKEKVEQMHSDTDLEHNFITHFIKKIKSKVDKIIKWK